MAQAYRITMCPTRDTDARTWPSSPFTVTLNRQSADHTPQSYARRDMIHPLPVAQDMLVHPNLGVQQYFHAVPNIRMARETSSQDQTFWANSVVPGPLASSTGPELIAPRPVAAAAGELMQRSTVHALEQNVDVIWDSHNTEDTLRLPQNELPPYVDRYHVGTEKTNSIDGPNSRRMEYIPSSTPEEGLARADEGPVGARGQEHAPQAFVGSPPAYPPSTRITYVALAEASHEEYVAAVSHKSVARPRIVSDQTTGPARTDVVQKRRTRRASPPSKLSPPRPKKAWGERCLNCSEAKSRSSRPCDGAKSGDKLPEPGACCQHCKDNSLVCIYLAHFPNTKNAATYPEWLVGGQGFWVVPQREFLNLPIDVLKACERGAARNLKAVVRRHLSGSFVVTWDFAK